ncbi:uncharacterized protein N0V89_007672 [Didymosphaeria variabile]|uniref:Uncharacterized protein n=1 Tax=Didymosphaeria variabile TaxID=1932322 RepID=A0A9W8XJJ4_9PLEO|nr:uncharacterized protein N0V89_007672 [Didymosphaeria variabile]KAJ4352324.1 hypothetical protein N0V89_007672 [Didymosphaeria variabile]
MEDPQRTGSVSGHEECSVSFMSLAAETRNQIYGLALLRRSPIKITYLSTGDRTGLRIDLEVDDILYRHGSNGIATALRNLTLLNQQLKKEAQTFFYANNAFKLRVEQPDPAKSYHNDLFFVTACVEFLEHCGADGRASLKHLIVEDLRTGTVRHDDLYCKPDIIASFLRLLHQCTKLEILEINNVLAIAPQGMKDSVAHADNQPLEEAYQHFSSHFAELPCLKKLTLGHDIKFHGISPEKRRIYEEREEAYQEKHYRAMMMELEDMMRKNLSAEVMVRTIIGEDFLLASVEGYRDGWRLVPYY